MTDDLIEPIEGAPDPDEQADMAPESPKSDPVEETDPEAETAPGTEPT